MNRVIFHLILFSQAHAGKRTGIYYIDSTCLPVCHLKRSKRHKTFEKIAQYGRTSVGWFFGLKLHIVISDCRELLMQALQGLIVGDKGYIGKELISWLLEKGLKLITRGRKNMKEKHCSAFEKQLLDKRGIIRLLSKPSILL